MNKPAPSVQSPPAAWEVEAYIAAARMGKTDVAAEFLQRYPAIVDAADADEMTALRYAARNGHTSTVMMLLEKGAAINGRSANTMPALLQAVSFEHIEVIELLLDKGAAIEAQSRYGMTALMIAAWYGYRDIVELLLERGASTEKEDLYERTAFICAEERGKRRVAEFIEQWPELKEQRRIERERVQAEQREAFLKETDCSTGLKKDMPAPSPLRAVRRKMKP